MGECLKICEENFCLKKVDKTAFSGYIILILMLDQFSQRRKMRIEQTHLITAKYFGLQRNLGFVRKLYFTKEL